ncbi:MAG: DMT family transporter [Planctomycetota bacterium]
MAQPHVTLADPGAAELGRTPPAALAGQRGRVDLARAPRAAAVQVFFGLFPVVGRVVMAPGRGLTPWALATWRIGFGALALGALALVVHRGRAWPGWRDLRALALFAVLGVVLNQGLFLAGLARSTAMNAALLICLIPVFTFTVAALARREAFSLRRGLGVVIALVAALPLLVGRGASLTREHALGNLLLVLNMVCYALYLVFSKPLLRRHPPLVVIAWVYVLSVPWLPLFAFQDPLTPVTPTPGLWWALAYVLVFPTVLAYLLNMFALSRLQASTTAFYVFAQPFVTALAAWFFLHERLDPKLLPAAGGLLLGLALVVKPGGTGSRGLVLRQPS